MSQWFRVYSEVVDDPKVQRLSPLLFKAWVNIMCIAAKNDGVLPGIDDVAYSLHLTKSRTESIIQELEQENLIDRNGDDLQPHNWCGRQFKSDSSTERVKRFRNGQGNVSETADETDQRQRQNQKQIQKHKQKAEEKQKPEAVSVVHVGEYGHVKLRPDDLADLRTRLNGSFDELVAELDLYGETHPSKFASYRNHAAVLKSWFGRKGKGVNGNGHQTKTDRNAEASRRLLSRINQQDSGGGERGDLGGDPSRLFGEPAEVDG